MMFLDNIMIVLRCFISLFEPLHKGKKATDYSQILVFKGVHELTSFGSQIKKYNAFILLFIKYL